MAREGSDPLRTLAARYRASQAGRTGSTARDFTLDFKDLRQTGDASAQIEAEAILRDAAARSGGLLQLETHPRDPNLIHLVRLAREGGEKWLFAQLGVPSPAEERATLAGIFDSFLGTNLPADWLSGLSRHARAGGPIDPFKRDDIEGNRELLAVLSRVLAWKGESLRRFASSVICRDSKRLDILQPRLDAALGQIAGTSLEEIGLIEQPRQVLIHGALLLDTLDLTTLRGALSLSEIDVRTATTIQCAASRILTVENQTSFHELVKANRGETLLIQTSYPSRAVLALLARLPREVPTFHFGDADPAGFDILRDLCERSGRTFHPLHMHYRPRADSPAISPSDQKTITRLMAHPLMGDCRGALDAMQVAGLKGDFEQESLGRPPLPDWPFYQGG